MTISCAVQDEIYPSMKFHDHILNGSVWEYMQPRNFMSVSCAIQNVIYPSVKFHDRTIRDAIYPSVKFHDRIFYGSESDISIHKVL